MPCCTSDNFLHAGVTSSQTPPATQWISTCQLRQMSHVVLLTSFCMQMWPHRNCCPRLNTQRCNIQRSVKATLYLLQEHLHQSHLLLTPADNLANSLCLPGKRSSFGSQGGEILALRHHWAAMRDLPVNSHATHLQHTCNTTCNTSTFTENLQVRSPFLVRPLQILFVSIWKWGSACDCQKTTF